MNIKIRKAFLLVALWGLSTTPIFAKDRMSTWGASLKEHSCYVKEDGSVRCGPKYVDSSVAWRSASDEQDYQTIALPKAAAQVVVGEDHACARLVDGTAWCWGEKQHGQLGDASDYVVGQFGPLKVTGVKNAIDIVAGDNHTCVLTSASKNNLICWGANYSGQCGVDFSHGYQFSRPVNVVGLPGLARQLSAGGDKTCVVLADSEEGYCFGLSESDKSSHPLPTALDYSNLKDADTVSEVSVGTEQTCLLFQSKRVACLGNGQNQSSEFVDGSWSLHTNIFQWIKVTQDHAVEAVWQRMGCSCALLDTGDTVNWGDSCHDIKCEN